jgi:cation:H+ antiporter
MSTDPNFANLPLSLLALIGGLFMLATGGEGLVSGASKFALRHGMRPMVVGLTIVAFGTSTPELFVSISAAFHDHVDIMIGNVVGSNIANVGLVLACAAILRAVPVRFGSIKRELFLMLGVSLLVLLIAYSGYFHRVFGMFFIASLILYTVSACRRGEKGADNDSLVDEFLDRESDLKIIGLQVGGLLLLTIGSSLFIDGAVDVAGFLGVSDLVIGLTVAAVGTSLPELASSLAAVRRRQSEILVGNIVGSNMFNLMMVMGGTAMVRPFTLDGSLLSRDLPVMIVFSAVLVPVLAIRHQMDRSVGVLLLLGYCAYMFFVV